MAWNIVGGLAVNKGPDKRKAVEIAARSDQLIAAQRELIDWLESKLDGEFDEESQDLVEYRKLRQKIKELEDGKDV